ncbi:DUF4340 domain-containing protein [Aporhodopirellula aestuarii]|uniref:DUF4340 domain-containing protein n=1 Tax=Aporhodopirellula aestuarii TaxID=2950107 RepID=A0ABT0UCI7_9BACT|nr:DUF4340 domain-containing protein [Aporhodopirellula aestuarii]MCM2374743.1 DUF4340 domain-containing protein [Aporhodopirellula aestuarii]
MNEGQKTGLFCVIGVVMLSVGLFVSWPASEREETSFQPGKELFENFKDPLAAASLKMVSFDEVQGQVETFEVRRDRETGAWTIPSRKGYPADAVEQMKNAANALVGLQILDVQTRNAEDHEALGVIEPKLEILEVGDVGVGRLVTFRDESQKDLASLIIGNPVKGEEGRRYVRKPGQDPVYVVELDESALSTKFQDWIEDDLLQLSSIDIKSMRIEDYAASMSTRGFSVDRNYTAVVAADGSDWKLEQLLEYPSDNPLADPVEVKVDPTQVVNKDKLNDIKNALDDLKIVDVVRKPDGMSANLRADKDLVSDNEAVQSLVDRGFLPVQAGPDAPVEVLSANGELDVTLNDGVEYVLRFGNVSGLTDEEDEDDSDDSSSSTAVNRYLLVTARVDESQFPAPELRVVPQTIEELAAMLGVEATNEPKVEEPETPATEEPASEEPAEEMKTEETSAEDSPSEENAAEEGEPESGEPEMTEETPTEETEPASEETSDNTESPESTETPATSESEVGEVEVEGSGEATGTGQGAQADETAEADADATENADSEGAEMESDEEEVVEEEESDEIAFADLSDEEKQERLEAEQEKILKQNTRMLDARKDRLNKAKRRVSDLNARFADWYYVIPETTYRELRIDRAELLTEAESDNATPAPNAGFGAGGPMQIPGLNAPR